MASDVKISHTSGGSNGFGPTPLGKAQLVEKAANEMETNVNLFENDLKTIKLYLRTLIAGGIFGALLAILGFLLWYQRIQVFQDAIIKNQAKQVLSDVTENKAKGTTDRFFE